MMDKALNWEFASTGGGSEEGIHNSLIEYFEGNYNYYLAREIIQNSIDARENKTKPVKVVFELMQLKTSEFPGYERFKEVLALCRKMHHGDQEHQDFFLNAEKVFAENTIPVLKVSDFNTAGLHGSESDRDSPWYALVKSRGVSPKGPGSGGSKGIGKGAAFAASHLRTAFYSTTSSKDARSRLLGVSMLVSFVEEGDSKQAIGSYGESHQRTVYDPVKMGSFWRKEKGLDVYIMGYKVSEHWSDELLKSILRNFWYAILCEDLIVEVGGKTVDFENLESLLSHYFLGEPLKDFEEPKGNPLSYYQAVMKGRFFATSLPTIGKVKFYYEQLDEPLNYVAMMRGSHMVIYSRSFMHVAPYSGVFICDDENGNELLRKLEPPTHDKWDPERSKTDGLRIMQELIEWVKACLREMKVQRSEQVSEIPGIAKYLPLDEEQSDKEQQVGYPESGKLVVDETKREEGRPEIFEVNAVIEPYKVAIINRELTGMGGKGRIMRVGKRIIKSKKPAPGGGTGDARTLSPEEFSAKLFSNSPEFSEQEYTAIISGNYEGKCNIKIVALGDEGSEKIKIKDIIDSRGLKCKVSNNVIMGFHMADGETIKVKVLLEEKIKVALKVEAYEIR